MVFGGCGSDEDDGPFDVRYENDETRTALQPAARAAIAALQDVYGSSVNEAFDQITLRLTTSEGLDAGGVAPRGAGGYLLSIDRNDCAGRGNTAHAIAHVARLVVLGDADELHQDRELFARACGSDEACSAATVERSGYDQCELGQRPGSNGDVGGSPTPRP